MGWGELAATRPTMWMTTSSGRATTIADLLALVLAVMLRVLTMTYVFNTVRAHHGVR